MKRPSEDSSSESDVEDIDVGRESVYPGHIKAPYLRCGSPTSQMKERKKRRGIIEKRRRDRINNSLSELRRLVPTAVEKQGSAKLEKAEILQMTVDHLKVLQASGGFLDVQTLALDFLSLGFRECMTEVSRYLSAVEGLDACDPLQARLLSHLTSAALTITSHRLPPQPPPFHPHHWAAAVIRPLYGPNVLSPAPDAGGAPYRLIELCQPSSTVSSSSSPSPSTSVLSPTTSLPVSLSGLPIFPSPSTSRPYRPLGTEVGAF
ncbi:hairy/enhancer-of-split related with YRPW motif protein 2 isoform X1 [Takifugu flavidus]|uniref:Hairy/enhancer-of-split related with YRPW motif protein 2 n=1 Tax=Takifugu flavidus TaxID=433684 RepID=A0A5C6NNH5_9TELE|nr:hairy/enhancer-of-split related with YRPW motif protein 2 isoform X1 [Takifugu flavidus]TWW68485.1 Hairy/enhancer-of-split related with YRPW motif protein 2 [Takifugu flavidus]